MTINYSLLYFTFKSYFSIMATISISTLHNIVVRLFPSAVQFQGASKQLGVSIPELNYTMGVGSDGTKYCLLDHNKSGADGVHIFDSLDGLLEFLVLRSQ